MSSYNLIEGTLVRFYTSTPFTTIDGTVADPTTVKFAYQVEGGSPNIATYGTPASFGTIVRDGTGNYHIDVNTSGKPGLWTWVWVGAGAVQTRAEGTVVVSPMSVVVPN